MRSLLIIVSAISFIFNEVYSIVPKYIPDAEIYFRQRSLDDPPFPKYDVSIEKGKSDELINRLYSNEKPKKITFNVPVEEDQTRNRLPEVNNKEAQDIAEPISNETVEDFIDLFEEEPNDSEENKPTETLNNKHTFFKELKPLTELEYNEESQTPYKRAKRVISAAYDGRYKSQDINEVLKSIAASRPHVHVKQTKNDSAKSRRKRTANVIEEENLGTTISGFKFTGRFTHLSHELPFKNIHS